MARRNFPNKKNSRNVSGARHFFDGFCNAFAGLRKPKPKASESAPCVPETAVHSVPIRIRPEAQRMEIHRISSNLKAVISAELADAGKKISAESGFGRGDRQVIEKGEGGFETAPNSLCEVDSWIDLVFDHLGKPNERPRATGFAIGSKKTQLEILLLKCPRPTCI